MLHVLSRGKNQSYVTKFLYKEERLSECIWADYMLKINASINIENVVASAILKQRIDLNSVVKAFPNVEYSAQQRAEPRVMRSPIPLAGFMMLMTPPCKMIVMTPKNPKRTPTIFL